MYVQVCDEAAAAESPIVLQNAIPGEFHVPHFVYGLQYTVSLQCV